MAHTAAGDQGQLFADGGTAVNSKSSSATEIPITDITMEGSQELRGHHPAPTPTSSSSSQASSLQISQTGTQTPTQDGPWTTSDDSKTEDNERHRKSKTLARTDTNMSIADTLSLPREILFVMVICFAQLFTQSGLGQAISIIRYIGDSFGVTDPGEMSWFIAGYSLTVGTFILFSGRLGDLYGHKTLFLIGMGWFSVWSMICGLAIYSNHVLFVFARVLQGIGPAIVLPNGLAILGVTYAPGRRKEMVFAVFGAMAPTGSVLGSLFAGIFALAWWPWAFWAFGIVLAATVVIGYYAIPPATNRHHHEKSAGLMGTVEDLDLSGMVLGVGGLVLVNFAWNQAPIVGWPAPYVYVTLILGLLLLAAFFVFEWKYAKNPLIPFHALSSDVSFVLASMVCGWSCFGIWFFYTWELLLVLREEPPLLATAMFSPVTLSGLGAALFTGYMLHHLKPPIIMTMALVAFTVGIIIIGTCPVDQTYWGQSFVSLIVMPWGMDMSFPAATIILSNAVPRKHQGIAASLVNTVVNYSISLGLGFAGTVETQVNNGGETPADILKGYRGAFYMGIGFAGLGVAVCLAFLLKSRRQKGDSNEVA
ncbi:MFS general substrate transporter [Hypoxylon sp. FL1284]|nr:MFS general substrate transporter [Hypoxylon sp. FL1284]